MTAPKRRRGLVSLPDWAWETIDSMKPKMGKGDAEVLRNIIISWIYAKFPEKAPYWKLEER